MKRRYRELQQQIDSKVSASIDAGNVSNATLKRVVSEVLDELKHGEFMALVAGHELTACKQRLRKQGRIEIVKGNEAKAFTQLTFDDFEFIDERRSQKIYGQLMSLLAFRKQHDMPIDDLIPVVQAWGKANQIQIDNLERELAGLE